MESDFREGYFAKIAKVESIVGQIRSARDPGEVNGLVAVIARDPSMSDFVGRVYEAQARWKETHRLEALKFGKSGRR